MSSPILQKFPVELGRAGEKAAGEKKKVPYFVSKVSEFVPESSCKCLFCGLIGGKVSAGVPKSGTPHGAFFFSPAVRSWGAAAHRLPVRSSSRPASVSVPAEQLGGCRCSEFGALRPGAARAGHGITAAGILYGL